MGRTSSGDRAAPLRFGDPAPFFSAETDGVASYALDVAAGRWIVLMVFGSLAHPASAAAHQAVVDAADLFDDEQASFFGVSVDAHDRLTRGLKNAERGRRYFWDFDQRVSRLFGTADRDSLRPAVFLIDRALRVAAAAEVERTPMILDALRGHLAAESARRETAHAPVLMLERVFEPEFCASLVACYEAQGGRPSGFAADIDGRTVDVVDPRFKRRRDATIADPALLQDVRRRLTERLFPMVKRAFGWQATEIERYLVACYHAEDAGFFSAHRDDATAGTAHRRFAVTINLNADHDGGALRFPEFGRRSYAPGVGGAVVFGCSLLHEVTPVSRGVRYAFVPFLYDEAGARLRRANMAQVDTGAGNRKARRAGKPG